MFLLYPPICLHCKSKSHKNNTFCETCQKDFTLLDPKQHCPYCFCQHQGACRKCIENKRFKVKIASALDHLGAAITLHHQLRMGAQSTLAASLLTVQFFRLKWEIPDLIIPIPSRCSKEYALHFAKSLGIPCHFLLKKRMHTPPQHRLPWKERSKLSPHTFHLKGDISGKTILLLDDLVATRSTIYAAVSSLIGIKRVYALTLTSFDRTT